ncbi:hypothetical protein [Borreliella bavariensis]|uniref:hypothetical protein n=1 Tax=Borreliella bavariensis TaxID=664662 RepID=UPI001C022E73|nr:hypothetical protein [Borreliella bavariensis]
MESKNKASYALQLSRLALSKAKNSLRQLESFALKSNEALGEKKKIKEIIENVQKSFICGCL